MTLRDNHDAGAPTAGRRTVLVGALGALGAMTTPAAAAEVGRAARAPAAGPAGKTGVHHLDLAGAGAARTLQRSEVPPFSLVGISWRHPDARLNGTVEIRTRSATTGKWGDWHALSEGHAGEGPTGRGGTEPLWTGPADGIRVRVKGRGEALPQGLRAALVAPGSDGTAARELPAASTRMSPRIVNRAGWGADESLVVDPPEYMSDAKAVFVHHTAGTNDYTSEQSPAIVRSIFLYHVVELGWNDLGYNFLVDKYGTLFEGRAGGTDKSVRAAHTYGFNADTSGIALLGDTGTATVTAAAKRAVADLAGWKLRLHGHAPDGTVRLPASADGSNYYGQTWKRGDLIDFHRIPGHRNGFSTLCPGENLYNALPEIRRLAARGRRDAP